MYQRESQSCQQENPKQGAKDIACRRGGAAKANNGLRKAKQRGEYRQQKENKRDRQDTDRQAAKLPLEFFEGNTHRETLRSEA